MTNKTDRQIAIRVIAQVRKNEQIRTAEFNRQFEDIVSQESW